MWCAKCQNELGSCVCPDINERLAALSGDLVVYRKCLRCQKHYALCKCENPIWGTNQSTPAEEKE